jgi:hypothetical protein
MESVDDDSTGRREVVSLVDGGRKRRGSDDDDEIKFKVRVCAYGVSQAHSVRSLPVGSESIQSGTRGVHGRVRVLSIH